jgi:hypothetical protein
MNILAGDVFHQRNPVHAPAKAASPKPQNPSEMKFKIKCYNLSIIKVFCFIFHLFIVYFLLIGMIIKMSMHHLFMIILK